MDAGPPVSPDRTEPRPEQAVRTGQLWPFDRSLKNGDLMIAANAGPNRNRSMRDKPQCINQIRISENDNTGHLDLFRGWHPSQLLSTV